MDRISPTSPSSGRSVHATHATHAVRAATADQRPYWGLFLVAAAVFVLDAVTTLGVLPLVPDARELNPIAERALAAGPAIAVLFKGAILLQVGGTAAVLRRLDAAWAGRFLFAATAAVGALGVGSALAVLLAAA
jgi:hypothetical protein